MPRVAIIFTEETLERLRRFVTLKYGERRAMSITVEQAVKEYLAREEKRR